MLEILPHIVAILDEHKTNPEMKEFRDELDNLEFSLLKLTFAYNILSTKQEEWKEKILSSGDTQCGE